MISRLEGFLSYVDDNYIVIDVNGVGYEVELNSRDVQALPILNSKLIIYTHMVIREDFHGLYGFFDRVYRDCFRLLIKVSGIGPKIGLSILSSLTVEQLVNAVELDDAATISIANGVGKKMAERLILELKGKIAITLAHVVELNKNLSISKSDNNLFENDLLNALLGLGFYRQDVINVIKKLPSNISSIDIAIKESLKILGNKL
jgi:Holliday junction DNA helicase RuvA